MLLLACLSYQTLRPQEVKLITVNQLEQRFKAGRDTTYVVNFWATWCKPCVNELPVFEKFKNGTHSKPIKVIMVSTDLKSKLQTGVVPFVKAHQLTGEVYLLDEAPGTYNEKINADWSGALPATLMVSSKTGKRKFHESAYTFPELTRDVEGL